MTYAEAFKTIYDATFNGNKELLDCFLMVDEALYERHKLIEEKKQYAWHDLRKNPDDLPQRDMYCICRVNSEYYFPYRVLLYQPFDAEDSNKWIDRDDGFIPNHFVIAWRELEPFEGVDVSKNATTTGGAE